MRRIAAPMVLLTSLVFYTKVHAEEARETAAESVRVEIVQERDISVRLVGPTPENNQAITCTGSCIQSLEPGAYRLYARRGDEYWPADWLHVWKPRLVEIQPPNRGAYKAGRVMAITFGSILGVSWVTFMVALLAGARCGLMGGCKAEWVAPVLIGSGIGMGASIVPAGVGLIMMAVNKRAKVLVQPLPHGGAGHGGWLRRAVSEPPQLGLTLRF